MLASLTVHKLISNFAFVHFFDFIRKSFSFALSSFLNEKQLNLLFMISIIIGASVFDE